MEMMDVWMWPQSVLLHGAEKTVSNCARAGFTDIFFLAKGLAGTTTFHGSFAPHCSQRDLLKEVLAAAHKRGIRVHAWFTSACDEHYKQQHPESGRCHYLRGKDRELISLADNGYLAYMEKVIRELCRNEEIDGLHLDYIRYNHLMYGWAEEDLARYAAEGAEINELRTWIQRTFLDEAKDEHVIFDAYRSGDPNVLAMARARRKDVFRFAHTLTSLARAERSSLILSAALMPEGAYEDTAFADLHYGQSYEDAAVLYDYALPMAYSKAYGQDAQWVKRVGEGTMKRGLQTIVGLHAYEGGTANALQADIAALKSASVHGICLFREGAFAIAYGEGSKVSIYNPTGEILTGVKGQNGEQTVEMKVDISPGEEKCICLPFEAQVVSAFAGEKEVCVYLTPKN